MVQGPAQNQTENSFLDEAQADSVKKKFGLRQTLVILVLTILLAGLVFYLYLRFIQTDPTQQLKKPRSG